MKNIYRNLLFFSAFLLSIFSLSAQNPDSSASATMQQPDGVEMADALRSNGKIYVVVAVLLIILTGLIIFLIRIDRKVSKLEKKNQSNS